MPVYYSEIDERKQFIEKAIDESMIAIDCSNFTSYLYKDLGYDNIHKLAFAGYDELVEKVQNRFPREKNFQLIKEIFSVLVKLEKEYIEAWTTSMKKSKE